MAAFIPKEQLESYRRWQVGSFDDPAPSAADPAPVPAPVQEQPGQPEIVTGVPLPTAEDIERMHSDAQAAGFAEGQQAGYEAGLAEAREEAARIAALGANVEAALAGIEQTLADEVLALAVELAGQVLRRTLAVDSEALLPIVREALAALPLHHGHVALHVNPADAAAIRQHLGDQFSHSGWHIIEDREIEAGGCFVRAGSSEVDATLGTRWKRVLDTIGAGPAEDGEAG